MEISKAVQSYLDADRIRESKSKGKKFYLSDMGKCMRMRWLKRKGIKGEFAPHVLWLFKIGDLYHEFVYRALESKGMLISSEDYVETKHFIGRYDGIVKDKEGKAVLDIKSAPAKKINQAEKGKDDEYNIAQVLAYQMLLMEQKEKDLKKSILLYVNKEPGIKAPNSFIERHYRLRPERKERLLEEMDTLVNYWEEDKIPPCGCPGWAKDYNTFQPLCQMSEKGIGKVLSATEKGGKLITTTQALYLVKDDKKKELKIK